MCSEFTIKTTPEKIANDLGVLIENHLGEKSWDEHIRLYGAAPVIKNNNSRTHIEPRQFSLKPPGTPYPTFNARLLSWDEKKNEIVKIYEKPTWKKPFRSQRCLIPMTGFIEPVYLNNFAGNMMEFTARNKELLYVAGLYEDGVNIKTGEVYQGMALILTTPSDFVHKVGHHRQPVFLKPAAAKAWLQEKDLNFEDGMDLLSRGAHHPELEAHVSRAMAKGWEKRIGDSERKFKKESQFIRHLERA